MVIGGIGVAAVGLGALKYGDTLVPFYNGATRPQTPVVSFESRGPRRRDLLRFARPAFEPPPSTALVRRRAANRAAKGLGLAGSTT